MEEKQWPGEWLRGVLGVCVLRVLHAGPTYGYAIASSLEAAGLGVIKGGTLYPLLARLEAAGHVTVEWRAGDGGPGRKYFALTPSGQAELAVRAHAWTEFAGLTSRLVAEPAASSRETSGPTVAAERGVPPRPIEETTR